MNIDPTLKKRLISGSIGIIFLLLLIIFGGNVGITLLAALLVIFCSLELFQLFFSAPEQPLKKLTGVVLTFLLFGIFTIEIHGLYFLSLFVLIILGLFAFTLFEARKLQQDQFATLISDLALIILGAIYISATFAFLPKLRALSSTGVMATILAFAIPWTGDTGAYFIGKRYGKNSLFKEVSPGKTVEGFIGGILVCIIFLFFTKLTFFRILTQLDCVILGIIGTTAAHLGDLFESLIKRSRGVKDSGYLIPGHGGFLDRFDAFMFTTPILYIYISIML